MIRTTLRLVLTVCALGGVTIAQASPTATEGSVHPVAASGPGVAPVDQSASSSAPQGSDQEEETTHGTVVTARKTEEELVDVPRSMTVFDSAALNDAGIQTIQDASIFVPNLRLTEFTSRRLSFPFVRGIGSGLGEPSVITYIDGVPQFGTGGTNLPLVGVERVEFVRGAQSTLYGRNALGGLISVTTKRPSGTPMYDGGLTFGNYGLQEYQLSASGPLASTGAFFSANALYSMRDGYTTNDFTGHDVDDRGSFFGRAELVTNPATDQEMRVTLFGERARDGGFGLSYLEDQPLLGVPRGLRSKPHHINQDFEGKTERDVVSPTITWDVFGDDVDFTSITAYENWDVLETSDFDFSPADAVRRRTEESQDYVYQELRFASAEDSPVPILDGDQLTWLVGTSGFWSTSDRRIENEFRTDIQPPLIQGSDLTVGTLDDLAWAIFAQAKATFDEKVDVDVALRYDLESKKIDANQTFDPGGGALPVSSTDESETFDEILPSASVTYHWMDDLQTYALASKGFKAGGFNLTSPAGQESFGPETAWTYEVGVKKFWMDERVLLTGALFYIDWDDMQLSLFDPVAGGYVDNAGKSTSRGFELEGRGKVTDEVDVFAGFGYTNTEFDEFVDQFGQDVSGNDLPFAPETTWSLGAQYTGRIQEGRWYVRGEYADIGDFFYDAGNLAKESWSIANFRVAFEARRWQLALWVRNAFDAEYIPVAFQPNPSDPSVFVGENGAPRTVGVTLTLGI